MKGIHRGDFLCLDDGTIYLNSAFTALTPDPVVQKLSEYYSTRRFAPVGTNEVVNQEIHAAYQTIAHFLGASNEQGLVFTKNCTEALNYVANCLNYKWGSSDNIVISEMEYLPNILPWIRLQERFGVELRIVPTNADNIVDVERYTEYIDDHTKLVSMIYVSNFYGIQNPIPQVCQIAHAYNALVVVDAAQAVTQIPVDVTQLGCDFLAFSGHKALGPTGTGILWIAEHLFEDIEPQILGDAGAELDIHANSYSLHQDYRRYWGGFSDVAGILGLSYSLDYVQNIGIERIAQYNSSLLQYAIQHLQGYDFLECFRHPNNNAPIAVVSFIPTAHITSQTLVQRFWEHGIQVQLMEMGELPYLQRKHEIDYCVRISLHFYNSLDDVSKVFRVLDKVA